MSRCEDITCKIKKANYSLTNNCYRRHTYYDYIGPGGRTRSILLSRAPQRKTTYCRRRAVSVGTLYIVEVGNLAAVVGSAAAAVSLAQPESLWAAR
jgi:hypothetical protein